MHYPSNRISVQGMGEFIKRPENVSEHVLMVASMVLVAVKP